MQVSTPPVFVAQIINGAYIRVRETEGATHMASVTLSSADFVGTANSTNGFSVRAEIRPQSGVFKGFFQEPKSREWRFFKGVIFQRTQSGHGAFMDDDLTGAVSLRLPAR